MAELETRSLNHPHALVLNQFNTMQTRVCFYGVVGVIVVAVAVAWLVRPNGTAKADGNWNSTLTRTNQRDKLNPQRRPSSVETINQIRHRKALGIYKDCLNYRDDSSAFQAIFQRTLESDPALAFEVAMLHEGAIRDSLLSVVITFLDRKDPEMSLNLILSTPGTAGQERLCQLFAAYLKFEDISLIGTGFRELPPECMNSFLIGLSPEVREFGAQAIVDVLFANSVPEQVRPVLAAVQGSTDGNRAGAEVDQALFDSRIASQPRVISDHKDDYFRGFVESLRHKQPVSLLEWALSSQDDNRFGNLAYSLGGSAAKADPQAAVNILAASKAPSVVQRQAARGIFERLIQEDNGDPIRTAEEMKSFPPGAIKDGAIAALVQAAVNQKNFDAARQWINMIDDSGSKDGYLKYLDGLTH